MKISSPDNQSPHINRPDIPNHELIKCIGHGSFGQVWLARTITGSWRAIKIVWKISEEDESCLKREYEGLQKYEPISQGCSSLVAVLHAGRNQQAGCFYYSMELADALSPSEPFDPENYKPKTLRSRLRQEKRLSVQECLQVGIALSQALHDLHGHELVHRDIKPSNVIYVKDVPKLADIGLITELDSTVSFVGTEGYVAPEGPGSAQSDIYSLGKLLYEVSTGLDRKQYPELPDDLMNLEDSNRFMSLQTIIDNACATDPKKRYDSAKSILADLKRLTEGKSIHQRRRPQFYVKLLLILLLATGGLVYWVKQSETKPSLTTREESQKTSGAEQSTNFLGAPKFTESLAPSGMVALPAGFFVMGDALGEGIPNARPSHSVFVDAFFMDKYEVTLELWNSVAVYAVNQGYQFTGAWAGEAKALNHPVHTISWFDALKWCNARSQFEGRPPVYYADSACKTIYKTSDQTPYVKWDVPGYRLPTEAEWEYAARGGMSDKKFSWGNTITHTQANYASEISSSYDLSETRGYHPAYNDGIQPYTSPVGSFPPNEYGLYDMAGNIWEWCWDWYAESYSSSATNNPHGPDSGSYRVRRGGCWLIGGDSLRLACRGYISPAKDFFRVSGFRTVMPNHSLPPK
jgi:formylglycine-generating enzyme required for sulfatase activity